MRFMKVILIVVASGLLAIGIGATVAIADNGGPEGSPEACVVVPPARAELMAACRGWIRPVEAPPWPAEAARSPPPRADSGQSPPSSFPRRS